MQSRSNQPFIANKKLRAFIVENLDNCCTVYSLIDFLTTTYLQDLTVEDIPSEFLTQKYIRESLKKEREMRNNDERTED